MTTWRDLFEPGSASDYFARRPLLRFDPDAAGYRMVNAWWLAELCRLVYRHDVEEEDPLEPRRAAFLERAGFTQLRFFNATRAGTQGFLVQSTSPPLFAALVFRGTEPSLRDWIHDIRLPLVPFRTGDARVHEGFLDAFNAAWPEVSDALDAVRCPTFYAGHSLGAAIATLAAARRPPRALHTFGSPRVGNEAFVASLAHVAVHRVVNAADIVTILPPRWRGYRHAGDPQTLHSPPLPLFERLWPPQFLADHAPINYVERLVAVG